MTDCEYCGKPLKAIGMQRSNGKLFSANYSRDWSSRKYHKKCYKLIKEQENLQFILENLKQTGCPPAS
jgi:exopolysaccharide biosynthesis protein